MQFPLRSFLTQWRSIIINLFFAFLRFPVNRYFPPYESVLRFTDLTQFFFLAP